jgi:hypothetical protein
MTSTREMWQWKKLFRDVCADVDFMKAGRREWKRVEGCETDG